MIIGDAAQRFGVPARIIRNHENIGLILNTLAGPDGHA